MAKLVGILARELTTWPCWCDSLTQSAIDLEIIANNEEGTPIGFFASERHKEQVMYPAVTRAQWEAERARIATNQQATQEARQIAQGEELPKRDSKLWKRAALAAFAGYCARPGMDAECAAEEAMFAADAFMNAMEKHLSSN